jgi:hypothetical protein
MKSKAFTASLNLRTYIVRMLCHTTYHSSLLKVVGDDQIQVELAASKQGQRLRIDISIAKHTLDGQLLGLWHDIVTQMHACICDDACVPEGHRCPKQGFHEGSQSARLDLHTQRTAVPSESASYRPILDSIV